MSLSRRQFLHMLAILASQGGARFPAYARTNTHWGRVLSPVATPSALSTNSPIEILGGRGDHFITHWGTLPQLALQPMPHYSSSGRSFAVVQGDVVQVTSTHAPLYQYASYHSPFRSTLGHGGILHAVDQLTDEDESWIQVADVNHEPLGWSPVEHWARWEDVPKLGMVGKERWILDPSAHRIQLQDGTHTLATFPVNHPHDLSRGMFTLALAPLGGYTLADRIGVPCLGELKTPLKPYLVHGVYWHHDFGRGHALPTLEVSIEASHWLRATLRHLSNIEVV